jgi:hypothetical protein
VRTLGVIGDTSAGLPPPSTRLAPEQGRGEGSKNIDPLGFRRGASFLTAKRFQKRKMIGIFTVPISKAQFRTMPPKERAMVFVCCHILNQIGVLTELVRFSSNRDPENRIEENASGTQTQIILRLLIAVLSEACVYFEDREDLIAQYLSGIHEEGREAYGKLQAFFDKKGLLPMIRNNYLYHYPNDKNVEKAFEAIPEDDPWEWYLSQANTNSLYCLPSWFSVRG